MGWKARRKHWDDEVGVVHGRARLAVGALACVAASRLFMFGVGGFQLHLLDGVLAGDPAARESFASCSVLYGFVTLAQIAALLVAAVLYLRWLSRTVSVTRSMITVPLGWTPSQAVWGFFIPFANLVRPYRVMRDLHDRLDPEGVPEPAPRPEPEKAADYRNVPLSRAPLPAALPHASIGLWWALYIGGSVLDNIAARVGNDALGMTSPNLTISMFGDLVEVAGALLAVQLVRTIDARLAERHRRLRHASNQELTEWEIEG